VNRAGISRRCLTSLDLAMDPHAIHDSKPKHNHQNKGPAVANEWQWHASNRHQRDGHADVLEDMGKNERTNPDDEEQPKLIAGKKSNEQTRQQQKSESAHQKH